MQVISNSVYLYFKPDPKWLLTLVIKGGKVPVLSELLLVLMHAMVEEVDTVGSKIIRALEIVRVKKLIFNAVL